MECEKPTADRTAYIFFCFFFLHYDMKKRKKKVCSEYYVVVVVALGTLRSITVNNTLTWPTFNDKKKVKLRALLVPKNEKP